MRIGLDGIGDLSALTAAPPPLAASLTEIGVREARCGGFLPNGVDSVKLARVPVRRRGRGADLTRRGRGASFGIGSRMRAAAWCSQARPKPASRNCPRTEKRCPDHCDYGEAPTRTMWALRTARRVVVRQAIHWIPSDIDRASFISTPPARQDGPRGLSVGPRMRFRSAWARSNRDCRNSTSFCRPLPLFDLTRSISQCSARAIGASGASWRNSPPRQRWSFRRTASTRYFCSVPTMFHYIMQRSRSARDRGLGDARLCISAARTCGGARMVRFEERLGFSARRLTASPRPDHGAMN